MRNEPTFFCPWAPHLRLPGAVIERRIAECKFLGIPPSATAAAYRAAVSQLPPAQALLMAQAGAKAALQWAAMVAGRVAYPNDGQSVLAALKSGLYEYLFLHGGRGGGKSFEVADAIIEIGSTRRERIVCAREFQASIADSSHALLVKRIKASKYHADWEITDHQLRNKNGTLITFIGIARNPESAKSLEGCTLLWIEEAQTTSSHSLEILTPTIRESGSMLVFTFNPRFANDPIYILANDAKEIPEASFIKCVQFEDNPHLFLLRLMSDIRSDYRKRPKRYAHKWRGALDTNSDFKILTHTVGRPPVLFKGGGARRLYGLDIGSTDPTAFLRMYYYPPQSMGREADDRGALYVEAEFVSPCRGTKDIVRGILGVAPELKQGRWLVKVDNAAPLTISDLNSAGIPAFGAAKGRGSVQDGIRLLQDFDIYINANCPKAIEAAENYRWQSNRQGEPTDVPEHKFSHVWDAARYAIEGEDFDSDGSGVSYLTYSTFKPLNLFQKAEQ